MTRRGRRRLFLLLALGATMASIAVGGYQLLKWRRAQLVVEARRSGLEASAAARYEEVLQTLAPHVRVLDDDVEVVLALAEARRAVPTADGSHLKGAAALYRRAADLDRSDIESRLALLELLPKLNLLPELIIASDEILELDPNNLTALEARVETFAAMGRWDDAVELTTKLIAEHPTEPRWRQLQASAAYAAGLSQADVLELVEAWPVTEATRPIDLAVQGVVLSQSGDREAGRVRLEQAAREPVGSVAVLKDLAGILGDSGRNDLAFQVFENYVDDRRLDPSAAVVIADWAMLRGERQWLQALRDTAALDPVAAGIVSSRLALFELLAGSKVPQVQLRSVQTGIDASMEAEGLSECRELVDAASLLADGNVAGFSEYLERMGASIEPPSPFQLTLAVVVSERMDHPAVMDWVERAQSAAPSLLAGAVEVGRLGDRGRSLEAIDKAIELAQRYPGRPETMILIARLWGNAAAVPVELETRLRQVSGRSSAFDLLARLVARDGTPLAGLIGPYTRAALREGQGTAVVELTDALVAATDVDVDVLIDVHGIVADSAPALASRLLEVLAERAPADPRVVVRQWTLDGATGVPSIDDRKRSLALDAEDPRRRTEAWDALLRSVGDLDEDAFVELAREALEKVGDSPAILESLVEDERLWSSSDLARSVIDRFGNGGGDPATRDVMEGRWALLQGTDAEFDEALSKLDARYVAGDRSLRIGLTLLSMLISRESQNAPAINRLGRQILEDHPEALGVYPVLIAVMQDAGMLEDAERLLAEFEAFDIAGVESGRQRVAQSLRTGQFDALATTMEGVARATGDVDDLYRLALACQATGDVGRAEQLFLEVLADDTSAFQVESARAISQLLLNSGRAREIDAVLSPFRGSLPDGVFDLLVIGAEVADGGTERIDALAEVVRRHPDLEDGWILLARNLSNSGQTREAIAVARDGLQRHPNSRALSRLMLGSVLVDPGLLASEANRFDGLDEVGQACLSILAESLNGGQFLAPDARQVRVSRDLAEQFPDDLVAWATAMAIHEAAGRRSECVSLARAASRRFPTVPEPAEWLARAAASLGQIDDAIAACRTWRTLSFPSVQKADETRAALEIARGDAAAALRTLEPHAESIIASRDRNPGPYRALLASMLMTGDVRGARRIEGAGFGADPAGRSTWANLASMAPYREGLAAMSLLEAATPPDATSRAILVGQWLDFHRRHPEGEALSRARQLVDGDLVEPRDFESRLQCLAQADIERFEGNAQAHRDLLQRVIDSYGGDRILPLDEIEPTRRGEYLFSLQPYFMALNNLAMSLLEDRLDLERAESLVSTCLELLPRQPEIRDSHAQILLALGRMSDAERSVVVALQNASADPGILTTAAEILAATGRTEEASVAIQRARDGLQVQPWPNRQLQARIDEVEAIVSGGP